MAVIRGSAHGLLLSTKSRCIANTSKSSPLVGSFFNAITVMVHFKLCIKKLLAQLWLIVGQTSQTLAQQWTSLRWQDLSESVILNQQLTTCLIGAGQGWSPCDLGHVNTWAVVCDVWLRPGLRCDRAYPGRLASGTTQGCRHPSITARILLWHDPYTASFIHLELTPGPRVKGAETQVILGPHLCYA